MSEPLSSVEIEDVLSSIRKLVSEDLRESQPRPRVVERGAEAMPEAEPEAVLVRDAEPDPLPDPWAEVPPQAAAMEEDEPPLVVRSKLILTPALRVVENAPPVTPGFSSVRQVMAVVGSAVDTGTASWEPETGDPQRNIGFPPLPRWSPVEEDRRRPFASAAEVLPEIAAPAGEAEVIAMADPDAAYVPGWAQEPGEERAEAEAVAPMAAANIEPDPAWADAAEEAVIAELEQDAPELAAGPAEAAGLPEEDGMAYEEQVLRDLVRDIIRDELQGDLGERITRNIRKLVRAEIARAIAAESLLS